jgi:hypothetical protein
VIASHLEAKDPINFGIAARDEYDAGLAYALDLSREFEPIAVRKLNVDENELGAVLPDLLTALSAICRFGDVKVVIGEVTGQHGPRHGVVLDDQEPVAALRISVK